MATQACVHAFSETDFRADLPHLTVPTLILHGDSDQIVPFEKSGARMPEFLPQSHTEVIKDGPHGLYVTHADEASTWTATPTCSARNTWPSPPV
ncbi:hypothetical protein CTI14_22440 [Methylobacterium radiotolerans]|nr:hypothetical protein CTI14_22440 [Methylobacterium radiotolerans]